MVNHKQKHIRVIVASIYCARVKVAPGLNSLTFILNTHYTIVRYVKVVSVSTH